MKGGAGWDLPEFKKMISGKRDQYTNDTFYLCLRNHDGEIISRRSKTYTENELKELNDPRYESTITLYGADGSTTDIPKYYVVSTNDRDAKSYNTLTINDNENEGGGKKSRKSRRKRSTRRHKKRATRRRR
jgi:hypothetical protein